MTWQVIDITSDDLRLSLSDNHLIIKKNDAVIGKIHHSDIASVIIANNNGVLTVRLMAFLAMNDIPIVICDEKYAPVAMSLPIANHYKTSNRIDIQSRVNLPTKNRLWRQIIRQKIMEQARNIEKINHDTYNSLIVMANQVSLGDKENTEAQAARIYWQCLFGADFRRVQEAEHGINVGLNYGYAVIRSAMARAIVATGLSPSLGVHHSNQLNPFCLIDDMMEPFRPIIDNIIKQNTQIFTGELNIAGKTILANIINQPIKYKNEEISLQRLMHLLAFQLFLIYNGDIKKFEFEPIQLMK